MKKEFKHEIKVYYEDTDSGGVVYYANYLKFLERARTEAIISLGYSNKKLLDEYGILIIVKSCKINFIKPARLEDKIHVYSKVNSLKKVSFIMNQSIRLKNQNLVEAEIRLATVNKNGKPSKIPEVLIKKLSK
tara:strand:- start:125 stop:523 length:399 start_codon:yes stop_codon:yes gene_type:complete